MNRKTEYREGPEAATRFRAAVEFMLTVPRSVILEREQEYKKQSLLNPNRRGPKPKKPVSPVPDASK